MKCFLVRDNKVSLLRVLRGRIQFNILTGSLFMKFDRHFVKTLYMCEKRITLPTVLTLLRIVLSPVIVVAIMRHYWGLAFGAFALASLSDMFDGMLARLWDNKTVLGACLDPVADKILLVSCFSALAFVQTPLFAVPHWFVVLILFKESVIVLGSLSLLLSGTGFVVHPTYLGKMTTVVQIMFIVWLFACYFLHWLPVRTYNIFVGVTVCCILASFVQYVIIGLRHCVHMVKKL
jgi:cardiolipin synthase